MINFQIAGVAAIAGFYAAFFALGWYGGRRRRSAGAQALLLADRKLPLWVGICTMTATWVGGGYINGTAEAVFDPGRGLVWAQAPWGYALSLMLGGLLFAGPMRRRGFTTLLDLFQRRYGKTAAALLYLPALTGELFWSAAILVALGTTFGTVLGFDSAEAVRAAILVSAAVAVGYTLLGGLWSVAYTDTLQLACIAGGLLLALPFALDAAGGLAEVTGRYVDTFGAAARPAPPAAAFSGDNPWGWRWADMACLLIFGGIPWQVYFQRVLACPDERTARRLSIGSGALCLALAVPAVLLGAAGVGVDWNAAGGAPPDSAALALPSVLRYLTPPLVAALGLGAVAAAVMSSVDSSILSAASMFACNVYGPLVRPRAGELEIRRAMRGGIFAVGAAAALLALQAMSVYELWSFCADLVYVVLFPQLVMALFFKPANWAGALAGAAVALVLRSGGGEPALGLAAWIPYPLTDPGGNTLFPFRTTAMLGGLVTIAAVSLLSARWIKPRALDAADGDDAE